MLELIKADFEQGKREHFRGVDNLTDSQVKWLIKQAEKIEKLHFDLKQTKVIGDNENVSIEYVLNCLESSNY